MSNGYIAHWKGQTCEVSADTSYAAQQKATTVFQAKAGRRKVKKSDVTVMIAEKDGEPVVHSTGSLG